MVEAFIKSEDCAKCQFCCTFTNDTLWDIPYFDNNLKNKIEKDPKYNNIQFIPHGNMWKVDMENYYTNNDLTYKCPFLDSISGCRLKNNKPFICNLWPFILIKISGNLAIALSNNCDIMKQYNLNELNELLKDDFIKNIYDEGIQHPELVLDYQKEYIIFNING